MRHKKLYIKYSPLRTTCDIQECKALVLHITCIKTLLAAVKTKFLKNVITIGKKFKMLRQFTKLE